MKVIPIATLPKKSNVIGNSFVLTVKVLGNSIPVYKAQWILQGHQERYRHSIANDSPMLMRLMFRVIISLSVILFACNLLNGDGEQAYMQSHQLQRGVFT